MEEGNDLNNNPHLRGAHERFVNGGHQFIPIPYIPPPSGLPLEGTETAGPSAWEAFKAWGSIQDPPFGSTYAKERFRPPALTEEHVWEAEEHGRSAGRNYAGRTWFAGAGMDRSVYESYHAPYQPGNLPMYSPASAFYRVGHERSDGGPNGPQFGINRGMGADYMHPITPGWALNADAEAAPWVPQFVRNLIFWPK